MGYCTWWLTIALCFSALAASQDSKTKEPLMITLLDDSKTKESPMITVFDDEEVESGDDEDMTEDDEGEMKLLSRDFMDTNPKEVKGQPDTPKRTKRGSSTCSFGIYNGIYFWSSPGYHVENYPNNFKCGLLGRSLVGTAMLTITLQSFELENEINGVCSTDKLETTLLNNRTRTLCGTKTKAVIKSPSFNFYTWFTTNKVITKAGFGMFVTATRTPCHQVITAAAGETNTISPPKDEEYCEYRIVAPTGSKVRIDYVKSRLSKSPGCEKNFILLNGNSEKMYPKATSEIICGKKKVFYPVQPSTNGEMYVAYKRTENKKIGFVLKYTII